MKIYMFYLGCILSLAAVVIIFSCLLIMAKYSRADHGKGKVTR